MEVHPAKTPDLSHFEEAMHIPSGVLTAELEKSKFVDVYLGEYYTDWSESEKKRQEVIQAIDEALAALDVRPSNQAETFVRGDTHTKHNVFETLGLAEGETIGMLLFEMTAWDLDIESDEDGPGQAQLTFRPRPDLLVTITGNGDFWTDRSYLDPTTGEKKYSGDLNDGEQMALAEDESIIMDSEVNFNLKFECRLEYEAPK